MGRGVGGGWGGGGVCALNMQAKKALNRTHIFFRLTLLAHAKRAEAAYEYTDLVLCTVCTAHRAFLHKGEPIARNLRFILDCTVLIFVYV